MPNFQEICCLASRVRTKEGYARLETCVRHNSDYMKERRKEFPNACNDPRDAMAVMYRNAQLFLGTKEIPEAGKRRDKIQETYEEVCRFMRYYHGLAKKTERAAFQGIIGKGIKNEKQF